MRTSCVTSPSAHAIPCCWRQLRGCIHLSMPPHFAFALSPTQAAARQGAPARHPKRAGARCGALPRSRVYGSGASEQVRAPCHRRCHGILLPRTTALSPARKRLPASPRGGRVLALRTAELRARRCCSGLLQHSAWPLRGPRWRRRCKKATPTSWLTSTCAPHFFPPLFLSPLSPRPLRATCACSASRPAQVAFLGQKWDHKTIVELVVLGQSLGFIGAVVGAAPPPTPPRACRGARPATRPAPAPQPVPPLPPVSLPSGPFCAGQKPRRPALAGGAAAAARKAEVERLNARLVGVNKQASGPSADCARWTWRGSLRPQSLPRRPYALFAPGRSCASKRACRRAASTRRMGCRPTAWRRLLTQRVSASMALSATSTTRRRRS